MDKDSVMRIVAIHQNAVQLTSGEYGRLLYWRQGPTCKVLSGGRHLNLSKDSIARVIYLKRKEPIVTTLFASNLDKIARKYEKKFGTEWIDATRQAHSEGRHTGEGDVEAHWAENCHICKARLVTKQQLDLMPKLMVEAATERIVTAKHGNGMFIGTRRTTIDEMEKEALS